MAQADDTTNFDKVDAENGFSVDGTQVIDENAEIVGDLADDAVSLEHLDSGIAPAFICVGAVLHTWDAGAASTDTATITGVLATDIIVGNFTTTNANGVTIEQIARTGENTVTITTSGNAADDDVIAIAAFRAAA